MLFFYSWNMTFVVLLFYIHGCMVASANATLFHFRLVFLLKTKNWLIHLWEENHGRLESFPWVFACRYGLNILVFVVERLVNMLYMFFFFFGFLIWTLNEWLTESLKPLVSSLNFCFCSQMDQIIDPAVDSTYKDIWMATAKVREKYFDEQKCNLRGTLNFNMWPKNMNLRIPYFLK